MRLSIRLAGLAAILLSILPISGLAQRAVDPANRYYRLICLVHMTGTGKAGDTAMPEFVKEGVATAVAATTAAAERAKTDAAIIDQKALNGKITSLPAPAPPQARYQMTGTATNAYAPARPGILAWSMQPTDDKQMAILYLVAAEHSAFDSILNDKRAEIKAFEIGKAKREEIEKEFQKYKKDFSLDSFEVFAQ